MPSPLDMIDQIAASVKEVPAITAKSADAKAYNEETLSHLVNGYVINPMLLDHSRNPLDELTRLSLSNIKMMAKKVKLDLTKALERYSVKDMEKLLKAVRKACDTSQLALTHDPDWSGDRDTTSIIQGILKHKKLHASNFIPVENEWEHAIESDSNGNLVYCGMSDESVHPVPNSTYFLLREWPKQLIHKCVAGMNFDENNSVAVGGNHFHAAWQLAAIHGILAGGHADLDSMLQSDDLTTAIRPYVTVPLYELCIPRELSLSGQSLVRNGVEEQIAPADIAIRAKPAKRDLTPFEGNPALKNKPHNRHLGTDSSS